MKYPEEIEEYPSVLPSSLRGAEINIPASWDRYLSWPQSPNAFSTQAFYANEATTRPKGARARKVTESSAMITALEARVRKLEALLKRLMIEGDPSDGDEATAPPDAKWIEANREVLRAHPDSFVALNPDVGIVIHSRDGEEFAMQLARLSPEDRDHVVLFHTSMFV